jgi:hypothetical protein
MQIKMAHCTSPGHGPHTGWYVNSSEKDSNTESEGENEAISSLLDMSPLQLILTIFLIQHWYGNYSSTTD